MGIEDNSIEKYRVRSLYFDDCFNSALFEKIAGVTNREKFRIRIYNEQDNFIKLERKEKAGELVNKESYPISRQEYNDIITGNIDYFKNSSVNLLKYFYIQVTSRHLKPVAIIDYMREAFQKNNIRITFDKDLKTGFGREDLFGAGLPLINALFEPLIILEVKYHNILPVYLEKLIQDVCHNRLSVSKYVICRRQYILNDWEGS